MNRVDDIYKKLFDALTSNDIQRVVKIAYDYFHRPITVIDLSYRLICQLPKRYVDDITFDSILKEGEMPQDIVWFLEEGKYRAYLEIHQKASFVDWGNLEKPRIMGTITNSGEIIGYFAILYSDYNYSEEEIEIAELFRKALGCVLGHQNYRCVKHDDMRHTLMRMLLAEKENVDLNFWKKACPELGKGKYVISVSKKKDDENGTSLKYICNLIEKEFGYCIATIKETKMYVLYYNMGISGASLQKSYAVLRKVLESCGSFNIISGISRDFTNLDSFEKHRYMAEETLLRLEEDGGYVQDMHFDEVVFDSMMKKINNSKHGDIYAHPGLEKILQYDKNYNTDFYNTLKTYITSFKNIGKTAEICGVHRNSIKYRLRKIEEVMEIDFTDEKTCAHLLCNLWNEGKKSENKK